MGRLPHRETTNVVPRVEAFAEAIPENKLRAVSTSARPGRTTTFSRSQKPTIAKGKHRSNSALQGEERMPVKHFGARAVPEHRPIRRPKDQLVPKCRLLARILAKIGPIGMARRATALFDTRRPRRRNSDVFGISSTSPELVIISRNANSPNLQKAHLAPFRLASLLGGHLASLIWARTPKFLTPRRGQVVPPERSPNKVAH